MTLRIRLRGINGNVEGKIWESSTLLRVGNLTTVEIILDRSDGISRRHAEIRPSSTGWRVRDLGSTNGTYLNGTRLGPGEWPIQTHDNLRFGNITFVADIVNDSENRDSYLGSFPISGGLAESISEPSDPISGINESPNTVDVTPPVPGNHPTLWKVTIPGNRPLATPAIANGKVFVGGGFGSYQFYAFSADTGELSWQYHTKDDGPTAAIVEDDLVAFNTESCELEVLTVDGTPVWKKWLGDPLMSMPAAVHGRIFIVFPDSRGDHRHYLACFHLRTGEEVWRQPVNGAAITTPVLAEGNVFVTTLDGTLFCFQQDDGKVLWKNAKTATSSPSIWNGQCYYSRRQQTHVSHPTHQEFVQQECLSSQSMTNTDTQDLERTWLMAEYLDYTKRQTDSIRETLSQSMDSSVGFHSFKGDADMNQSQANLGHGTVAGVWSYQGSRPFVYRDRLYSCMGASALCVDPTSGNIVWKTKIVQGDHRIIDHILTPPVLVNGKVFIGTLFGEVICLCAETGNWLWREIIGEPIAFQPAVAKGRIYVPTAKGSLHCLETGDEKDDGWLMWGGTPAHNGVEESLMIPVVESADR
jgi:Ca-activated chloride channel homolog